MLVLDTEASGIQSHVRLLLQDDSRKQGSNKVDLPFGPFSTRPHDDWYSLVVHVTGWYNSVGIVTYS